ncbi:MAG: hypothetical protein HYR94_15930 [Chloroflexi bacterium]|nr:hypothetical protein [Chloroflexota bacterium]
MYRKLVIILCVLVVISLTATAVFAQKRRSLLDVNWSLGSLKADGTALIAGFKDVTLTLDASGIPIVACTNQGGNQAPGQNPPRVNATDSESLGSAPTKNGKKLFGLEAEEDTTPVTGQAAVQMGCPNGNWTAQVVFVRWDRATIIAEDGNGTTLFSEPFNCQTTPPPSPSVSCTPVP